MPDAGTAVHEASRPQSVGPITLLDVFTLSQKGPYLCVKPCPGLDRTDVGNNRIAAGLLALKHEKNILVDLSGLERLDEVVIGGLMSISRLEDTNLTVTGASPAMLGKLHPTIARLFRIRQGEQLTAEIGIQKFTPINLVEAAERVKSSLKTSPAFQATESWNCQAGLFAPAFKREEGPVVRVQDTSEKTIVAVTASRIPDRADDPSLLVDEVTSRANIEFQKGKRLSLDLTRLERLEDNFIGAIRELAAMHLRLGLKLEITGLSRQSADRLRQMGLHRFMDLKEKAVTAS